MIQLIKDPQRFFKRSAISPPGVRIQLTLWYTVVSAALMLLFGVAFYSALQQTLATNFDTALRLRSQQIAEEVTVKNGQLTVDNILDELPELDATAAIIDHVDKDSLSSAPAIDSPASDDQPASVHSLLVRIFDTQGHIIYDTPTFAKLTLPAESMTNPLHNRAWNATITNASGQPVRIYSTMLVSQNRIFGVVQVGESLAKLNTTLNHILLGLLIVTPFVLALSAYGSYWLSGRAFRPIRRLAHTAREISATDLHQRVPVPFAKDEVQDLALIFNQMISRLERAFSQQRRFVADASHELRTPVAVIRSLTEVAISHPSSAEDSSLVLREVNSESERLGRLINDLLSLARADEGQIQLDHEPVRLDLLASDVVESLTPLAQEKHITLQPGTLASATVMGDAARLIQIMMGLVDNALNYTNQEGCITVAVTTCQNHVHLSVQDTGIGISAHDQEHIFERFYRADPARSKAIGGSGLGLSIVDWLVQAHKGTVTVESILGHGSTFLVTLPLANREFEHG